MDFDWGKRTCIMSFFQAVSAARAYPTSTSGIVANPWFDIRPWDSNSDSGSGNLTNLGTLGGSVTVNGATRETKDTYSSWYVDGVNDYIEIVASESNVSVFQKDYTIESWFYRHPRPSSSQLRPQVVLSTTDSNYEMMRHSIASSSTSFSLPDRLSFAQIYTGSSTSYSTLSHNDASANYAEWYHLTTVVDGLNKNISQYINGSLVVTHTSVVMIDIFGLVGASNGLRLSIGRWERPSINSDYQVGWHGDLRVYNRTLSSTEVLQNYNATKTYYGHQ